MITEDYVSFETAKLLKEKGFDWCESPFYSEQDRDEWRQNNSYTIPNMEYNPDIPFDSETLTMVAPHVSLQMAMKWLREEKHIFVELSVDTMIKSAITWRLFEFPSLVMMPYEGWEYNYEQACETAIKYCLENLI